MGATHSSADVYADTVIDAGFSAVFDAMAKTAVHTDMTQIIDIGEKCTWKHVNHLKIIQRNTVNLNQLANVKIDANVEQQIEANIKATAEAMAKGFGIADAESRIVTPTTLIAKNAITSSVQSIVDQSLSMIQRVNCSGTLTDVAYVDIEQIAESNITNVMKSDSVVKAKQDIKATVETAGVAKALGVDAWAIAVIVVAIAIVVVLVYGSIAGKLLTSTSFWLIISTVVTAVFGYVFISSWTGTWPGWKADVKDSDLDKKRTANHNSTVRKVGGIGAAIGGVLMVFLGYLTFKKVKKT
jgi:hypothetical protein